MKQFFAHLRLEDNGLVEYHVNDENTVLLNLKMMFGELVMDFVYNLAKSETEFHDIKRWCQYVVKVTYDKENGLRMAFIDHSDIDNILDFYSAIKHNGWNKEDLDKYIEIAMSIKNEVTEIASICIPT